MNLKKYTLWLILTAMSLASLITQADSTNNSLTITPRIVGGQVSTAGKYPWMIALVSTNSYTGLPLNPYDGQFCGASLISPTWVITAGHCVQGETTKSFNAVANIFNLRTDKGQTIAIKRIIQHPYYDDVNLNNDIALIQLVSPVNNAKPLALIEGTPLLVNVNATVMGWGSLKENGTYPDKLYEVTLPIVSNAICNGYYSWNGDVTANMLCAGFKSGGKDTCQGDSGGPLVIKQNNIWHLAGITSYGNGCAQPYYYGVYTRISKYLNFINKTMTAKYATLADVNHDTVIDLVDKTQKDGEFKRKFQRWVMNCWNIQKMCGDINHDNRIDMLDYNSKQDSITHEFNRWLSIYFGPEVK